MNQPYLRLLAVLTIVSCITLSGLPGGRSLKTAECRKDIYRDGWIDFNKNGKKDVYEDSKADVNARVETCFRR
jgi:beta-glucosidase